MLDKVESTSGALIATDTDGYAISKPIVQEDGVTSKVDIHTDYTSASGIASASSEADTNNRAWCAFDEIDGSGHDWYVKQAINTQWIKYEFTTPKIIKRYMIGAVSDSAGYNLSGWTLYGSNDGTTWVSLHAVTNQVFEVLEKVYFDFSNDIEYKHYKLDDLSGGSGGWTGLGRWQMYEISPEKDFAQVKNIVGKFEFANISEATVADTLITIEKIKNGDNLVIVKDDDSIHEFVVGIVSSLIATPEFSVGDTNISLAGNKATKNNSNGWANGNAFGETVVSGDVYFEYMISSTNIDATKDAVKLGLSSIDTLGLGSLGASDGQVSVYRDASLMVDGVSTSGYLGGGFTLGDIIGMRYNSSTGIVAFSKNGTVFPDIQLIKRDYFAAASIYQSGTSVEINTTSLQHQPAGAIAYESTSYFLDTTSVTQGEIPTRAYRVDEKVSFNDVEAVKTGDTYGGTDPLLSTRSFSNTPTPGREIVTKVNMSATGNKMKQLDFVPYTGSTPITATDITELTSGSCNRYPTEPVCASVSTHKVAHVGANAFVWSVDNGLTITAGQGTDEVTVNSSGSGVSNFTLTCELSDGTSTISISRQFVHTATEIPDPVAITSLTETTTGSCKWENAGICSAESLYDIVATDADTYTWSVDNGAILTQVTPTQVKITTTSQANTSFTVTCEVHGLYGGVKTSTVAGTHTRSEKTDEFDQDLLYNNTNIAGEFI